MKSLKILCLAFISVMCLNFDSTAKKFTLVIDAGHGGKDNGASILDASEKNITLSISQLIKENAGDDINIILLREQDQFMSLNDRVNRVNKIEPDLLISLNVDSHDSKNNIPVKAYIADNDNKVSSKIYATDILKEMNSSSDDIAYSNFYILKNTKSAAISLSLGNLSNDIDFKYLTSISGQKNIADNIIKALQ